MISKTESYEHLDVKTDHCRDFDEIERRAEEPYQTVGDGQTDDKLEEEPDVAYKLDVEKGRMWHYGEWVRGDEDKRLRSSGQGRVGKGRGIETDIEERSS